MKRNQANTTLSILILSIAIILSNNVFAQKPVKPAATPMYEIGLPGPAGGIVFYISDGGGNRIRGRHGMEVAPVELGFAPWGCIDTAREGNGTEIGTGARNTEDYLALCPEPGIAAAIASSYELNGFTDWYLPSLGELSLVYSNLAHNGKLSTNSPWYISSTIAENPPTGLQFVCAINMTDKVILDDMPDRRNYHAAATDCLVDGATVRPVRSF